MISEFMPIKGMPPELRDGRQVIIWNGEACVCRYRDDGTMTGWDTGCVSEIDGFPEFIDGGITHYAEIRGPDDGPSVLDAVRDGIAEFIEVDIEGDYSDEDRQARQWAENVRKGIADRCIEKALKGGSSTVFGVFNAGMGYGLKQAIEAIQRLSKE